MKKVIKTLLLLGCVFFPIGMTGCNDDDDEDNRGGSGNNSLEVSSYTVSLSSETSSSLLEVTADNDWGSSSSQKWCVVSPTGGVAGKTEVTVRVESNTGDEPRTAILTFKSGSTIKEVSVTQDFKVKEVEFADENFKKYCLENFDANGDGLLSLDEAMEVNSMSPSGLGITSMDGLEYFPALDTLDCSNNQIAELNVSKLSSLESLNCSGNKLATLSIQTNINLQELNAGNNPLTTIHVWTGFPGGTSFIIPESAQFVEPEIPTPVGYRLVWQDEFNDSRDANGKGVLPNDAEWWYEEGDNGWGNNEIQNYIPAVKGTDTCAFVADGNLNIIAKKVGNQIYSIRMNTRKYWTYGYFEGRLKLPKGKGLWSAFWMMPQNYKSWPDDGEIDIMEEVGYDPNVIHSSIHCKAYYHKINTQKTATKYVNGAEGEFHIYAVEWTPEIIKGYVDGECYFEFKNDGKGNYDTWPFDNPFYLKLNLAWGGDWGGNMGVDESVLPAVYEIDYIRVFQKD